MMANQRRPLSPQTGSAGPAEERPASLGDPNGGTPHHRSPHDGGPHHGGPGDRRGPLAVVTGASRGIGRLVAEGLLDAGFRVVVTARSEDSLEPLRTRGALPVVLDLADEESIRRAAASIRELGPGPHLLVHNAGYGQQGALEEVDDDAATRQLRANVLGPISLTRALLPGMRRAAGTRPADIDRQPRILLVTSVAADLHQPMSGWYCASKAALASLADTLRLELRGSGIDVVEIRPGPVDTGWQRREAQELREAARGGRYEALAARVADRAERRAPRGLDPARAARRIIDAATASHPRARYSLGRGVGAARLIAAAAPPRLKDAVLARYFR